MKVLAQVNAIPTALLWDDTKVVMQMEFTVVDPNSMNQTPQSIDFVVDAPSLIRLGNDLVKMAEDLKAKALEKGFTIEDEPIDVEAETEEGIDGIYPTEGRG